MTPEAVLQRQTIPYAEAIPQPELRESLKRAIEGLPRAAVSYIPIRLGQPSEAGRIDINGHEPFNGLSITNLLIAAYVLHAVEQHRGVNLSMGVNLDEFPPFYPLRYKLGRAIRRSPDPRDVFPDHKATLGQLLTDSISRSGDYSTQVLADFLGRGKITTFFAKPEHGGLYQTSIKNPEADRANRITTLDMANFLACFYSGSIVKHIGLRWCLFYLMQELPQDGALPQNAVFAKRGVWHGRGVIYPQRHEAGILKPNAELLDGGVLVFASQGYKWTFRQQTQALQKIYEILGAK